MGNTGMLQGAMTQANQGTGTTNTAVHTPDKTCEQNNTAVAYGSGNEVRDVCMYVCKHT